MSITSSHATGRLIVLNSSIERISLVTESNLLKSSIVRIIRHHTNLMIYSLFSHFLRLLRCSVNYSHRHSEFQRIGKFAPFHSRAIIDRICCRRDT